MKFNRSFFTFILIACLFTACRSDERKARPGQAEPAPKVTQSQKAPVTTLANSVASGESSTSVGASNPAVGEYKWWDGRIVRFRDYVGNTGDLVYEQLKGMKYFHNTRVFVYSTDVLMEGTREHSKVEELMQSTRLDDRIFIWAHFDENRNLLFFKTLISDNIKDDLSLAKQEF